MQKGKTGLVWFGNNLRVRDNNALTLATSKHSRVIGIYCLDVERMKIEQYGFKKMGKFRAKFLLQTLQDLKNELEKLNIPLYLEKGSPITVIPKYCKEFQVDVIYYQEEFTAEEIEEINSLREKLPAHIDTVGSFDQFLFHPDDMPFQLDQLPQVFTNFRKKVECNCTVLHESIPNKLSTDTLVDGNRDIPSLNILGFDEVNIHPDTAFPFKGGSNSALDRVDHYFFQTQKLSEYKETRNGLIGADYSSKLSAWLANGSISPKTIYWKVKQFEKEYGSSSSSYWLIFELLWRDYFKYLALKHGNSLFKRNGILNKPIPWKKDEMEITNWIEGKTEEPFVNANMIELKKTGWMSNRGRQNVASYFSKSLGLDWRIGAAYFEEMLIDYDVHSNYGNWQYVAGVGNDPRDRKFNVSFQAERYDPDGEYRKLWLQS
ncbi:DASH family cryptochrome [Flagellimonas iocasae]|uniref:Cryptochrome DASH n=1 Tax=Flagellimonas iocasae TaxID=2055905 RepID=A0ABW4XVN0_9FLAO